MTAPSVAHERHVATLEALAALSGYAVRASVPGLVPDVVRRQGSALFLGEAKHTEHPHAGGTQERISRYIRHISRRRMPGDLLVLCVSSRPPDWATMVTNLTYHATGSWWHVTGTSLGWNEVVLAISPPWSWSGSWPLTVPSRQPR